MNCAHMILSDSEVAQWEDGTEKGDAFRRETRKQATFYAKATGADCVHVYTQSDGLLDCIEVW